MKKLLILSILFCSLSSTSQVLLNISQDARLAILGDDKGNDAFTINTNIALELRQDLGRTDVVMRPEFEYANLAGGDLFRYSANFGLNFRDILPKTEFTTTLGYGLIHRNQMAYASFGANLQTTYFVTQRIGIFADAEFIQRNDVVNTPIRFSGKIGIKIKLN